MDGFSSIALIKKIYEYSQTVKDVYDSVTGSWQLIHNTLDKPKENSRIQMEDIRKCFDALKQELININILAVNLALGNHYMAYEEVIKNGIHALSNYLEAPEAPGLKQNLIGIKEIEIQRAVLHLIEGLAGNHVTRMDILQFVVELEVNDVC